MSSSPTETTVVDVTMPQMGVSVAEGTIADWKKKPGDWIERDETIVEISQITSSASTRSPGCLCHLRIVPSATETPICGIVTSTIAVGSVGE